MPKVAHCDGAYKHNTREHVLAWRIPSISADNATGAMEFAVRGRSTDAFFPVRVAFTSADTLCPIAVRDVQSTDDGHTLRHKSTKSSATEEYIIE